MKNSKQEVRTLTPQKIDDRSTQRSVNHTPPLDVYKRPKSPVETEVSYERKLNKKERAELKCNSFMSSLINSVKLTQ